MIRKLAFHIDRSFLSTVAATALLGSAANAGDRALVVGIDDYSDIGLEAPLSQDADDAQRFATFLVDTMGFAGDEITLLTNDAATSTAITNAVIDRLIGLSQGSSIS